MSFKSVNLPNYTIGENAYDAVLSVCRPYGTKAVLVGGHKALKNGAGLVKEALKGSEIEVLDEVWFGGEASYENVEMLKDHPSVRTADMVFAFGGGKAIDTCKVLTQETGKYFFTFPTIAATCAAVTMVCAMYHPSGEFRDLYWRSKPAEHTFINTRVVAEAPEVYLWAGIGDTLAKGYEPEFSSRGRKLDHSNSLGVTLSVLCGSPLTEHAAAGMASCKRNEVSDALEETVLTVIVSTGLVSNFVINDYNSVVAHAMCYGFTVLKQIEERHLHGECVSYGVLVQLMLDNKMDELEKMLPFYREIGLPTKLSDLEVTESDLPAVFAKAASVNDVKVAAFPVTEESLRKAVEKLEAYVKKMESLVA